MANLPKGFSFGGVACGIKKSGKPDLAIICCDEASVAAGVYTQNLVRAASIDWNRAITPTDDIRAVVINSGNANACTGDQGTQDNLAMATLAADAIGIAAKQVLVLSTGVIGHHLPMENVTNGIGDASQQLANNEAAFERAANAILTTDNGIKTVHESVEFSGGQVSIAGMAKGAGMIGPNMATMLAIMVTDAKLDLRQAETILQRVADASFNRISVEGHTSTNDALLLICSGNSEVNVADSELDSFEQALTKTCIDLAKRIPSDGEGATHLIEIRVEGANSVAHADQVARTIAASALVKTAVTGCDPNWGRIVSAAGYSGVEMEVEKIDLEINGHDVFKHGQPISFDETVVSRSMSSQFQTNIRLKIGDGEGCATHWTSDLTVDYVRFNSEYTT